MIQDSDEESSRSSGEEEEGGSSSGSATKSSRRSSSSGSSSSSDDSSKSSGSDGSDDETEDDDRAKKPPPEKPFKVESKAKKVAKPTSGKSQGSASGEKSEFKILKKPASEGKGSSSPSGSVSSALSGDKKSKFFNKPKGEGGPKKRPPSDQNGPVKKKVKVGPDGKPVAAKPTKISTKVKVPGAGGGAPRPPGVKKEKGQGGLAPRPPSKKKEGQGADSGKEEKTPKAEKPPKPPAAKKPAKKKRLLSQQEDRELKKTLRLELKKRQTDAKTRVTQYFKRESKISLMSRTGNSGSGGRDGLSSSLPPEPSTSILKGLPPDQSSRLVNTWNFLHTFAHPLGLVSQPTLPELTKALRTLDSTEDGEAKERAEQLWQEICVTLVKAVAVETEEVLGVRTSSQMATFADLFSKKTGLMLPFNSLTWPEMARLCLLTHIYRELGFSETHIQECIRGRFNYRKNKAYLKLLKQRMEGRKARPKPAADPKPSEAETSQSSSPESGTETKSSPQHGAEATVPASKTASSEERVDRPQLSTPKQTPSTASGVQPPAPAVSESQAATPMDVVTEPSNGPETTPAAQKQGTSEEKEGAAAMQVDTEGKSSGDMESATGKDPANEGADKMQVDEEDDGGETKRRGSDDEDEEDDEEEEEEETAELEITKELDEFLASPNRSENEKRMAYVLKRLLAHSCSELMGVDGTQSLEVASSLVDYPMMVWQPIRVATLVGLLKDGVFSGEDGPELLARHANIMCYNSFATNIEDSEPWSAADRFSAIFERLLKKWILDPTRPPLEALHEESCHVCGKGLDKAVEKVTCTRCSALIHPWCLSQSQKEAAQEEGWCCPDCVSLTLRRQWYPTVRAEPSPADIDDLTYSSLPPAIKRVVDLAKMTIGDWGPTASFPPLLDPTINRTVFHMIEEDSELGSIISAVAILASSKDHGMEQRLILLDALCNLASGAQGVRHFLTTQEDRIVALRKKMPEDEAVIRNELKAIGGDAAVLAWKDPLMETTEADAGADDEEEGLKGICCVCQKTTGDEEDQSRVILCEICPTEIHLACLDPNLTEAPKGEWYCPRCKANKHKKRKAKGPLRPEDMEDPLEKEREHAETRLFESLVEERAQKMVDARAREASGDAAAGTAEDAAPKETCEYCGFGELEICSPLVLGQSREETEEHIKMLASAEAREGLFPEDEEEEKNPGKRKRRKAAAEGEPLPPLVPYFPRKDSSHRTKLPTDVHYPIVHERCAVQILGLRAQNIMEREDGKADREERLIEDALRISGTRTFPLGEDRHGRCYWKMPGDEERLFVWVREASSHGNAGGAAGPPRGRSTEGHWLCYESKKDIEALIHYLSERDAGERALKASLVEEFFGEKRPKMPHYDESLVIRKPPEVVVDETKEEQEGKEEAETSKEDKMDVVPTEGEAGEAGGAGEHGAVAQGRSSPPAAAAEAQAPPQKDEDATESERDMQVDKDHEGEDDEEEDDGPTGPVALKLVEAKCQVDLPPEEMEIEIPTDLWGDDWETRAAIRKTRKFYALALVDAKDRVWEERTISVKYEVFRGGDVLETSTALRAHKDNLFWFYAYEFRTPGIYTLRFSVVTEPYNRSIRPFCVRINVRGYRAFNTYGKALNSLSFLNITRGGRLTHRQAWEIHIPEGADAVTALRIALLQLKESLPYGALVESEADLAAMNRSSSGSKSSGSSSSKGPQFIWTDALQAQWTNHLMEASCPQDVMEDLLLLENCLHPDWLKPWYSSLRRAYTTSHSHLLRSGTAGPSRSTSLSSTRPSCTTRRRTVPRSMRSARAVQPAAKPARRARVSYAEPSDEEEDDDDDYKGSESEEDEDEDEDDPEDEDYGPRSSRSRRASKAKKQAPLVPARPKRGPARDRAIKSYLEKDDDDFEEEEELSDEGARRGQSRHANSVSNDHGNWACPRCTYSNKRSASLCGICGSGREVPNAPASDRASAPVDVSGGVGGGAGHLPAQASSAAAPAPPPPAAPPQPAGAEESEEEVELEDENFINTCRSVIKKLWNHKDAEPFREEVSEEDVPGYHNAIKHPMCIRTLRRKLKTGKYKTSYQAFLNDGYLIVSNAEKFNGPDHDITKVAYELKGILDAWAAKYVR